MGFIKFKLISKKKITSDVFELVFLSDREALFKSGQFITFLLPKTGFGRAYSVLKKIENKFYFLVKRLENGRGGSKELCDLEVGNELNGVGPAGHFLLRENNNKKLFIGTGTGIVPLYNMSFKKDNSLSKIIWGNRESRDLYYIDELKKIKIDFEIYLSREKNINYKYGRVSEFLTKENIKKFDEFYICGNPDMVESIIKILQEKGVNKDFIFTEKY